MAEADLTFDSLLDLLRRLPPTRVEENVNALCDLAPEYTDDLLGNVDQPLKVLTDGEKGREFLGCDYNRDGDSFRSSWSNDYLPTSTGGPVPSSRLRELEVSLNAAFDTYREMYFEGGISSVYLWDLEDDPGQGKEISFAGVVLMKKVLSTPTSDQPETTPSGSWDSLHVFECQERGRSAKYKLTSTVMLVLETKTLAKAELKGVDESESKGKGGVTLSGSMTRQAEVDYPLTNSAGHIPNIGRMVEDMEIKMRNLLSSVYFGKTKDVINELRSQSGLEMKSKEDLLRAELAGKLGGRRA
ncbi:capping protein (actin filament) muscle Z-line, beta [Kwoniella mangroviensis CBS 10435]|uniref:F-actin-capping protein subunit beta n=1 Tax=Kwoniella mangroviensis CBS 10435 TaxID=1331196 RepID=A0A1B9IK13_9TREE|nr:capping protein (actin filament) muscle Z-line, beta [Kwoniella mangroviensis CBS 8507]OCF55813.1 capping protein (actin filament) muscle Z-line, beta [Kwoniella mangroviensis CBS 10435]OCF65587.1 capping protein (actin filament) muscle Z-line, beta [Kwoniella mangroviensis CBS 8507]OCF71691.1 capping protein (actin filament) muscle Z-line, beta [Kwoniella mangroviensis CBS 8886]